MSDISNMTIGQIKLYSAASAKKSQSEFKSSVISTMLGSRGSREELENVITKN
jgi:hypothetical protein